MNYIRLTERQNRMKKSAIIVVVLALLSIAVSMFLPWYFQVNTGEVYSVDGVALSGTDPVAYFTDKQSVKGNATITHTYKDATWHFSNAENREMFAANPNKYVPAYGGYCSYGMAYGGQYPTVPEAWVIVDGRLYLNYSKDMQSRWTEDQAKLIKAANDNWAKKHP